MRRYLARVIGTTDGTDVTMIEVTDSTGGPRYARVLRPDSEGNHFKLGVIFDASDDSDARELANGYSNFNFSNRWLEDLVELSDPARRMSAKGDLFKRYEVMKPTTERMKKAGFKEVDPTDLINGIGIDDLVGEALVRQSRVYQRNKHAGQYRKDKKTPFSTHPEAVMQILADAGIKGNQCFRGVTGYEIFSIAQLHDVVEDCDITLDDIEREFNNAIARRVSILTRDCSRENYKKKLLSCNDQAVHFVKLADVIHNCRTLSSEGVSQREIDNKVRDREFYLGLTKESVGSNEEIAVKVSDYLKEKLEEAIRPYVSKY